MKRSTTIMMVMLLATLAMLACGGSDAGSGGDTNASEPGLLMGILQFRVQHNLEDDSCLPASCDLSWEEEDDTAGWLDTIATHANMAVLHWDRPIPWLVFDDNPPQGVTRVDFFDGRLDAELRDWINAFADHFAAMPHGYLAVSALSGERNRLERCRVDRDLNVEVNAACPDVAPGTQIEFQYDPGTGPVTASFDLERSYGNFVMYLYDKLQPDYLALLVEANLFKEMPDPCPAKWHGLVELYRNIYDRARAEVDSRTKVFATLTLAHLLAYDVDACHGGLAFEACAGAPSPPAYPVPDPSDCYPLDLSAIVDLDQGNRLEVLALSFYPDALLMDVAADNLINLYPEDWDGFSECTMRAQAPPFIDPVAALDRLGWAKPVAIAELGFRSMRTLQFNGGFILQPPGDLTSQAFWLENFLRSAQERKFLFYVQSFLEDYDVIGPWVVNDGVLDANVYSVMNSFVGMGLYDKNGQPKPGVTDTWLDALP